MPHMDPISRLEHLVEERENSINNSPSRFTAPAKKRTPQLTLKKLMMRDNNRTIEVRTGLSREEFSYVLGLLRIEGEPIRRGRKLLDLDLRLVIILEWLRHGETFDELAFSFNLSNSHVQTCISSIWDTLASVLMKDVIPSNPNSYEPTRRFTNYPGAVGALDSTLIPLVKPGCSAEDHLYYSGKHHKHGFKAQVLVSPDGQVLHFGGIVPGSVHDFILYQESGLATDMAIPSKGRSTSKIQMRPQILADGGYMGIHATYPEAVIPIRKPRGRSLNEAERETNRLISQDRCLVECFFARLKRSWAILQRPYRSDRTTAETLIKICICLTCIKIRNSPLIRDHDMYNPDPSFSEEEVSEEHDSTRPRTPTIKIKRKKKVDNNNNINIEEVDGVADGGDISKVSEGKMNKKNKKK